MASEALHRVHEPGEDDTTASGLSPWGRTRLAGGRRWGRGRADCSEGPRRLLHGLVGWGVTWEMVIKLFIAVG